MRSLDGKRALITGADGFIGSHLAERLVREGAEVTALCVYNSNGSAGWLDNVDTEVAKELRIVLGDIRDAGFVTQLLTDIDIVFHLAALIAIPYSYLAPRSFVETNVIGTLNILEAARNHSTPLTVNTSTSEVYGTPMFTPITETHPLNAQSPYAASKVAADQLTQSYAYSFGVNAVTLRPFNTYGPRQSLRAVIPTILAQMLNGADVIRLGSLHTKRDFTYVSDTVDGFVRIGTTDVAPGETIQLGTGNAVSIGELVEICADITGSSAEVLTDSERVRPDASEVQLLLSDPTQAALRLGWAPGVDLRAGLTQTAEWLRSQPGLAQSDRYHR